MFDVRRGLGFAAKNALAASAVGHHQPSFFSARLSILVSARAIKGRLDPPSGPIEIAAQNMREAA